MSLVKRPKLTPQKLAALRSNARLSRGPATPEGRERMRAANTRHGFYAEASGEALRALGEDPADFERLVESLAESWLPADSFEERLVIRLARALWRMERSDRVQESMAVRQLERQDERMGFRALRFREQADTVVTRLKSLAAAVGKKGYCADAADIECFEELYASAPYGKPKRVLALLRRLLKPDRAEAGSGPALPGVAAGARIPVAEGRHREKLRKELHDLLWEGILACENARSQYAAGSLESTSPYERDEMLAPVYQDAALMARMEESSFRQVWRLTNLLIRLKSLTREVVPPENEGTSNDVIENKGK